MKDLGDAIMGGSLSKVVIEPLRLSNDLHNHELANFLAD